LLLLLLLLLLLNERRELNKPWLYLKVAHRSRMFLAPLASRSIHDHVALWAFENFAAAQLAMDFATIATGLAGVNFITQI